jgi:hypothetical protein
MLAYAEKLLANIRGVPCYNIGQHAEYTQNFSAFPQSLQANAVTISQIKPAPLAYTYFLIHYSLVMK